MNISPFLIAQLTLNSKGNVEAPSNVIQSLPAAITLADYLRQDNYQRNLLWATIEGLINGNPPYNQDELDANGLSHVTNYNNFIETYLIRTELNVYHVL